MPGVSWRHSALAAVPVGCLLAALAFAPYPQPQEYHAFADQRGLWGVPHFGNVVGNIAFLIAGGLGLSYCNRRRPDGALAAWVVFFAGFVLVAFGSAYYHWDPGNGTLVWDRLTMAVGFAGLYGALVAEYAAPRLQRYILPAALVLAVGSVIYWAALDDLRFYFAVQGTVFLTVALLLLFFAGAHKQKGYVLAGAAAYGLAIACEQLDRQILGLTGGITGGHAVKHLLAAVAAYVIYRMLRRRVVPEAAELKT